MSILGTLLDLFKPASEVIDALHTSDEERLDAKAALAAIQAQVITTVVTYEAEVAKGKAQIITAEAQSQSAITRMWRPIVMLTFAALIVVGQLGGPPVPAEMWPLLKIGLGGYIVGRSGEKITKGVVGALKEREEA